MSSPRRKVSTLLDEALYRRAKLEAVRQGKQISEILGEALASYLRESPAGPVEDVVNASFGSMRLEPRVLKALMEEEDWLGSRT